jgi:hypothetical protein
MSGQRVAGGTGLNGLGNWVGWERQQPEGTRIELVLTFGAIRTPAINWGPLNIPSGQIVTGDQLAAACAAVLNAIEEHTQVLTGLTRWPNTPFAQAVGAQCRIRWVKMAPGLGAILDVLGGLATFVAGLTLTDIGIVPLAALAVLVAIGLAVLVNAWQLVAYVVHHPGAVVAPLALLGGGALIVAGVWAVMTGGHGS